jgi:hypothetical protein
VFAVEGITEIVYGPTATDTADELEAFINMANTTHDGRSTKRCQRNSRKAQ